MSLGLGQQVGLTCGVAVACRICVHVEEQINNLRAQLLRSEQEKELMRVKLQEEKLEREKAQKQVGSDASNRAQQRTGTHITCRGRHWRQRGGDIRPCAPGGRLLRHTKRMRTAVSPSGAAGM
jgi:hypothetical protein